jgi:hypothetical protein
MAAAQDLTATLSKLSPQGVLSIRSSFPVSLYGYQRLQPNHIRVLTLLPPPPPPRLAPGETQSLKAAQIECELVQVPLEHAGQYEALSYVWGSPERSGTIRIVTGEVMLQPMVLQVTESLLTALLHLRYAKESRRLWVDQLCINQDDTTEREAQVRIMGEVYSKASCTVVWLGVQCDEAQLMKDMYNEFSTRTHHAENSGGVRMLDQQAVANAFGTSNKDESKHRGIGEKRRVLEKFLGLPWFCRAWVYQEAVVASRVDIVWGRTVLPLDFVIGLIISVYSSAKSTEEGDWHRRIKKSPGFSPLRAIYHDRQAYRRKELDFLNVLWHARKHLNASDHRDYVFAFLAIHRYSGTSSEPFKGAARPLQDEITPSYIDPVEEVYTKLARAAVCSSCSLDILQYVVPTKQPDENYRPDPHYRLPTWVPNWADRQFVCGTPIFIPGVPIHLSACGKRPYVPSSANSNLLELTASGHTIGRIRTILQHSFQHTFYSKTLREAYRLKEIQWLLEKQVKKLTRRELDKKVPDWFADNLRETLLRTILADGSFTETHDIPNPIPDLLRAYDNDDGSRSAEDVEGDLEGDAKLRYHLRQMGEVARGKRVFLTEDLDIGLGFSTIRKGDIVCVLHGSKTPCILRKDPLRGCYTFVGLCFLHGWMDGTVNPRSLDLWNQTPETFVLI